MKKELTAADIEKLYAFLQKKFVDTYDVQTELVDHLASDIELQWERDPSLSLDEAMQKVYKSFGIFGFTEVYEQRVAAIQKEIQKQWLRTFLQFFKLPYLLFSLVLFLGNQLALTSLDQGVVKLVSLGLLTAGVLYFAVKEYAFNKRHLRRKLSVMQYIYGFLPLLYLPMYINYAVLERLITEVSWPYALHITVSYILAIAYISTVDKIKQKAKEQYPIAFA
ncbi:hypothetical protein [Pontibacter harenae]|uniref:hypothetical protein n=1 Tax=Pontibacter harenae TaxID=2894083 RepID=UPI001E4C1812|nr:hypothetical protein [Pontibacter harenae]MCC9169152.1 hypothetical protein [Pontibacter harenae]